MSAEMPDFAYYYPAPYWGLSDVDPMKSLLLFFDGIAILLPRYMAGREEAADPVLAGPLRQMGLLKVLEPETFVDQQVTEALIAAMVELLTQGAFDDLDPPPRNVYQELSRSRMGWGADVGLSEMITEELISRGLARPSEDGVSIPLHPVVRMTFLVLLSQLARDAGRRNGLTLHPTTTQYRVVQDFLRVMSLPGTPSAGHLVTLDLETVGLNLATVPLEELLEFRDRHGASYRAYARHIRQQVRELGLMEPAEREEAMRDRRTEIADMSEGLRDAARRWWKIPLPPFAIGVAGAAWLAEGPLHDPVGAAFALAGAGAAVIGSSRSESAAAYSYIFDARREFGGRSFE